LSWIPYLCTKLVLYYLKISTKTPLLFQMTLNQLLDLYLLFVIILSGIGIAHTFQRTDTSTYGTARYPGLAYGSFSITSGLGNSFMIAIMLIWFLKIWKDLVPSSRPLSLVSALTAIDIVAYWIINILEYLFMPLVEFCVLESHERDLLRRTDKLIKR
jgi:hypothetical protein